MSMEIKVGDIGIFSGRVDKKAKVLRVDDTYVTYLEIDENKKKYIYLADFKKRFKKEGEGEVKQQNKEIKTKEISDNKKIEKPSKPSYTIVGIYLSKDRTNYEETENLNQKGLLGYRIRYNKEPNMFFGNVNYSLEDLDEAKKRVEYSNENAEKQKEFKKIRDAENKIKREENKIIEKQKLETATKEIIAKPSFLMTLSEYQEKVVPILLQYQKFLRKNSEYLQPADYEGIYQYTYPELEKDFENKTIKGRRFAIGKYQENPLENFKASHYPDDEIVEMNKSFVNKLKNFFTESEIYSLMSKDEYKSNKRAVKRAIDNDTYKNLLESEELTESELQKIADSVDVSIPKKVFSVENVKMKEMQQKFAKLLSDLPTINKEQLNKLIESIKIDFKPLEEEVFIEEKLKYTQKFRKLLEKEKVYVSSLDMTINIWEDLFSYDKTGYDKIKTGTYKTNYYTKQKEEIIDERQYVIGLKFKSNWETLFDKYLKNYTESLKYSFINAIINNFIRITKPIIEIVKIHIELGERGFEGVYRFKFDDGSYFDFKAEAIRAGGYNIQILHLRYITNFENITLADGSKIKGYYNLIENFNIKRMKKGGSLGENIKCVNCGWHWNTNQSEEYDKYVCHKCGFDNTTFYSSQIMKKGGITHEDIKNKTDKYKDMLKRPSNLLKISQMHKVPLFFLQSQLIKGMKVESEHTTREAVSKIIALHHLEEDPRYYIKLEKIEGHIMADGGKVNKIKYEIKIKSQSSKGKEYEKEFYANDILLATTEAKFKGYSTNQYVGYNNALRIEYYSSLNKTGFKTLLGEDIFKNIDFKKYPFYISHFNKLSLKDIKNMIDYTNNEQKMSDSGDTKSIFYKGYKIGDDGMYRRMNTMAKGGELDPDNKAIKSAMTHKAGSAGGLLVGNRHSEGGIKAINKSTNSPIEMEGGEVVITRNAVSDNKKREFEGKMMTNREILSRINESGGGVSFASGGDVPSSCKCSGKSYKYGGKSVSDYDIINSMNKN